MYWHDLTSKTIGIWGMGKEGQAAFKALNRFAKPTQIITIDESNTDKLYECDVVIKSPGVSLYRPEIIKAQKRGIILTSGSNLFMTNKPDTTKIIGVTGTKGKSTTSSLLYHTLKTAGLNVAFGGNIGKPLVDLLSDDMPDFVVAELSSYQCADFTGQCDMAVLTNLFPEHLQWHTSHHRYYADKCHMVKQAEKSFINGQNETVKMYQSELSDTAFFNTTDTVHINNGLFYNGTEPLFDLGKLNLVGTHNAENACAVLSVALQLNIPLNKIEQAFQTFQSLPHRLQIIGTYNGITYVDDSISTTPETAIAAVKAFDNNRFITLIVGGFDRGQNFDTLINFLTPMKERIHLITMPDTGERAYISAVRENLSVTRAETMKRAVQVAKQVTPSNGIVILSPASPSYNSYTNFEERGTDFQKNVSLHNE